PSAIKIIGTDNSFKAEIINAEGKTVCVSDKTEISTSRITSGIYTIRITTDSNVVCKKLTLK
ncbi:MAG: T9SS type A sorting domain-containing protein, partial [Paludibacteraceae bacterium]|nr:T9SS type A sorting domain-containing protein [Paludibacteraceae bacterium]